MRRLDHRVLTVPATGEPAGTWTVDRVREQLASGDFDGIELFPGAGLRLRDLAFLREASPLRVIAVTVPVKDDTAAFEVPGVRELALHTRSKLPVPPVDLPELVRLAVHERPGLEASKWPALEDFMLDPWTGADCGFLAGAARVRNVELAGKNQVAGMTGLEGCAALETLRVIDAGITDLAPLRGLTKLKELRLVSVDTPHGALDLRDLTSPVLEKIWIGNAPRLRHLEHFATLPALAELRLLDCTLTDADRAVLASLPERVRVHVAS